MYSITLAKSSVKFHLIVHCLKWKTNILPREFDGLRILKLVYVSNRRHTIGLLQGNKLKKLIIDVLISNSLIDLLKNFYLFFKRVWIEQYLDTF